MIRGTDESGALVPFVAIDSSTIQSSTAESILFGHEKGAFTGAERTTKGVFEEADGGIVYFDEIANMSLEIQSKLLRVLQEKEIARLGSSKLIPLQFRVISATNLDLEEMCSKGRFKDDLYQRLCVVPLKVPPLRERREDIPLLLKHFSNIHRHPAGPLTFTSEAIEILTRYNWPGNVRELVNLIAYLSVMSDSNQVESRILPEKIRLGSSPRHASPSPATTSREFYKRMEEVELSILRDEYRLAEGNVSQMATNLGMDRSHLYTKLKQHGIHTTSNKKS